MHDFHFFGAGWMMFLWLILLILLIVFTVRAFMNSSQNKQAEETPMEILKRRYASGEIDEEEFNRRKKELQK